MKLPCTLKLRHTGSSNGGRGGEGPMVTQNLSCTLSTLQDQTLITAGGGTAYGINPQGGGMNPLDHELGETQAVCHMGGVMQVNENDLLKMRYIVRRLTPTEAERLMGLPDGYTIPRGLKVTDELVAEFQRIFDTFKAIMYEYAVASYERSHREGEPPPKPPKPKAAYKIRTWLEKITATCPDSPRYKACGNGWATNQPRWILTRLLSIGEGIDPYTGETL